MKTGLFFEEDKNTLEDGMQVYRYRRVFYQRGVKRIFPISCVLRENGLIFHFNDIFSPSNPTLIRIPFTNFQNFSNELDYQINRVKSSPFSLNKYKLRKEEIYIFQQLSRQTHHYPPLDELFTYLKKPHQSNENPHGEQIFSSERLFLDFLYDCFHSPIFRNSPYYSNLVNTIYGNHLWKAILAKWDYHYYHWRYYDDQEEIVKDRLKNSEKVWLDTIMSEESTRVFKNSPWFSKVEKELSSVINNRKYHEGNVLFKFFWKRKDLEWEKISEWLLSRFAFFPAYWLILDLITLILMLFSFVIWKDSILEKETGNFYTVIRLVVLGAFFVFIFLRNRGFAILNILSPRLIFIFFTTWVSFDLLSSTKFLIVPFDLPKILIGCLILGVYLFREIRTEAQDLHVFRMVLRAAFMLLLAATYTTCIGILVSNEKYRENFSSLDPNLEDVITYTVHEKTLLDDSNKYFSLICQMDDYRSGLIENLKKDSIQIKVFPSEMQSLLKSENASSENITKTICEESFEEYNLLDYYSSIYLKDKLSFPIAYKFSKRLIIFPYHLIYYAFISLFFGLFLSTIFKSRKFTGF